MYSLLFYNWTNWIREPVEWINERSIARFLEILVWILIVLEFPYSWKRGLLALAAVVLRQFFPVLGGSTLRLLEMIILAIFSNLGTKKTNAWTWLGVHVIYIVLLILFNTNGLVADYLKPEAWLQRFGGEFGHSLGMAHSNSLAIFTMSTVLMIWYLMPYKKLWASVLLFAGAAFFCLWFTKSKTVIVLLIASPFIFLLVSKINLKKKAIRILVTLLPLIACVITFGLSWFYFLHKGQINYTTFWMRFGELEYLIEYFHFPFGPPSFLDYPVYFDNFYVFAFVCCGYIPFVPIIFSFCFMHWKIAKDNRHELLAITIIFLLYSEMENCIFYPVYFFVPLLVFAKDVLIPVKTTELGSVEKGKIA